MIAWGRVRMKWMDLEMESFERPMLSGKYVEGVGCDRDNHAGVKPYWQDSTAGPSEMNTDG